MPADAMLDANGVAITVGATVKLVGTVQSVNGFDNRYNDVVITLAHPVVGVPDVLVGVGANAAGVGPGAVKTISVAPGMLVVGA